MPVQIFPVCENYWPEFSTRYAIFTHTFMYLYIFICVYVYMYVYIGLCRGEFEAKWFIKKINEMKKVLGNNFYIFLASSSFYFWISYEDNGSMTLGSIVIGIFYVISTVLYSDELIHSIVFINKLLTLSKC